MGFIHTGLILYLHAVVRLGVSNVVLHAAAACWLTS